MLEEAVLLELSWQVSVFKAFLLIETGSSLCIAQPICHYQRCLQYPIMSKEMLLQSPDICVSQLQLQQIAGAFRSNSVVHMTISGNMPHPPSPIRTNGSQEGSHMGHRTPYYSSIIKYLGLIVISKLESALGTQHQLRKFAMLAALPACKVPVLHVEVIPGILIATQTLNCSFAKSMLLIHNVY